MPEIPSCEVLQTVLGYCVPGGPPTIVSAGADKRRFVASTELHEAIHHGTFMSTGFGFLQTVLHLAVTNLDSGHLADSLKRAAAIAMDESRFAHEAYATFAQRFYIEARGSESEAEDYIRQKPAFYQEGCEMYAQMVGAIGTRLTEGFHLASTLNDAVFQSSAIEMLGRILISSEEQLVARIRESSPNRRLRQLAAAVASPEVVRDLLRLAESAIADPSLAAYGESIGAPERVPCFALLQAISGTCLPIYGGGVPATIDRALFEGIRTFHEQARALGLNGISDRDVGMASTRDSRIRQYGRADFVVEEPPPGKPVALDNVLTAEMAVGLVTRLSERDRMLYVHVGTPSVSYAVPFDASSESEIVVVGRYSGEPLTAILNQIWFRMLSSEIPRFIEDMGRAKQLAVVQSLSLKSQLQPSYCDPRDSVAWYYHVSTDAVAFAERWLSKHVDCRYAVMIDPRRDSRAIFLLTQGDPCIVLQVSALGVRAIENAIDSESRSWREMDPDEAYWIGGTERAAVVKDHIARWGF